MGTRWVLLRPLYQTGPHFPGPGTWAGLGSGLAPVPVRRGPQGSAAAPRPRLLRSNRVEVLSLKKVFETHAAA